MSVPNDEIDRVLRATPVFQKLTAEDRRKVAEVAAVRHYKKGQIIFEQGTPSDAFYTIASGRVKIFRMLPTGKDVILEVFGTGDPVGALAAYDGRPFPASAATLEDTACVVIPRGVFFRLLEEHPSLVRGLMLGLTHRLVELTNRVTELSGARIEPRFARLFLKLAGEKGREGRGGTFVPVEKSRTGCNFRKPERRVRARKTEHIPLLVSRQSPDRMQRVPQIA